jgi:tetratricopeptide (TPR) repeat protein
MIQFLVAIVCLLILCLIFFRRYFLLEKRINVLSFLRKRNFIHKAKPDEENETLEITFEEMIPPSDDVPHKNKAKADTLVRRAGIFMNKGDLKSASQNLIEALSLDPSSISAYETLALIFLKEGFFGKAENIYKKLILTIVDDAMYLSNLAFALFSQGKHEEAKKYYLRALELDNTRAGRFFSLAQVHRELREFEDAIKNFRRAIEMDPRNIEYLLTLAQFYIEINQFTDAKQLLNELLLAEPDNEIAKELLSKIG